MKKNKIPFIPISAALCFAILGVNTPSKAYASEELDESKTTYSENVEDLGLEREENNSKSEDSKKKKNKVISIRRYIITSQTYQKSQNYLTKMMINLICQIMKLTLKTTSI